MITSSELVQKIKKYQTNFDEQLVVDAYELSFKSHSKQIRSSGEPYFIHPLAVAESLIEYKLDSKTIITALLHDTVEDTDVTLEDIEKRFGEEVAALVDGVTKLGKLESLSPSQKAAENFRKLVMAMSQDIRVLVVKLADRLHNMQTINFIKSEEKRVRIAKESLAIYAPLAARVGMYKIRDDIQELSFAVINPEAQSYIIDKLDELEESEKDIIDKIFADLKGAIDASKIISLGTYDIAGRKKKPFSIWNKMKSKNVGFGHLHDIMAFRIIVEDVAECYSMMGVINCNYSMIPDSFKDYISTPKENDYQSLHLLVLGPQNKKIEIQIRTKEMNRVAELGVAAHWNYKEKSKSSDENEQYAWIRELIGLFEQADAGEVLRDHKIQMHKDQVFCFTPNGDVFNLPVGATIVDFAYAVHSGVGNRCVGAKVNGTIVPLRQKLNNGDQVEIVTEQGAHPSPNWMQFVATSKAKVAIKNFIRNKKHSQYVTLGKAILNKFFATNNLEISDRLLEGVLIKFHKKTVDDLYVFVAEGLIPRNEVLKAVYPMHQDAKIAKKEQDNTKNDWFEKVPKKNSLAVEGLLSGMALNLAICCQPIPGDDILGVINTGSGVSVHNKTCPTLKTIALNPQKLLHVHWRQNDYGEDEFYQSRVMVLMHNKSGSLADVSSIIAQKKINIANIKINQRSSDFFEVVIDMNVKNTEHLEEIMSSLKMSKKIIEVNRFEG
ncbi:MAG: GTP pyrophosphokinase [Myxococcota bacterium]|jgi:GTP pyrophosphokinase